MRLAIRSIVVLPGGYCPATSARARRRNFVSEMGSYRSANTAFAAYLRCLGVGDRVVVEQGFEIARPSRLYLDVADPIRVGGKVHPVLTGTFAF